MVHRADASMRESRRALRWTGKRASGLYKSALLAAITPAIAKVSRRCWKTLRRMGLSVWRMSQGTSLSRLNTEKDGKR
jgi:hypothetical protein